MTIDLINRYQLGEQMDCGSQGQVVSGVDTITNQQVAIKIFPISKPTGAAGFACEYLVHKIMQGKSKRLCCVLESFQIPNKFGFIVMEKYKQDLFDLCFSSEQKLSEKKIKRIFKAICKGIRDLHTRGIAHLDIKPENVLVDKNNKPFICDFGCSYVFNLEDPSKVSKKVRKSVIENLRGRGTRKYAAPEVFTTDEFNPFCADIWSLGILLHAMLTSFFPVSINDSSSELNLTLAEQTMSKSTFTLLASMLAVDPTSRPSIENVLASEYFGKRRCYKVRKQAGKIIQMASI